MIGSLIPLLLLAGVGACADSPMVGAPASVRAAPNPTVLPENATLSDVAEATVRGVVNISTTRVIRFDPGERFGTLLQDPLFRHLFGSDLAPSDRELRSLGSGVLVGVEGLVLTSSHVVKGASEIEVTLHGGQTLSASIVGADAESDVAVIRLNSPPNPLTPLPIGNAAALRLGEVVLAVGNPLGVGETVTMGIVSAKGRSNLGILAYEDFIQTDAAINPGNSGGALVDSRGELVGINTAIASSTGGSQGIGFAIPIEMAIQIMNELVRSGQVHRGWLGLMLQDLNASLATALGLAGQEGVLVSDVISGSPGERAGIRRADLILAFNGAPVRRTSDLRMAVATAGPGAAFTLEVLRDGSRLTLAGDLGTEDRQEEEAVVPAVRREEGVPTVGPLTDRVRTLLGIPAEVQGVVVAQMSSGGSVARAGLAVGDVIVEVNQHPVTSARDFTARWPEDGKDVLLLVWRDGITRFVVVER